MILVAGGTGRLGTLLVRRLVARGESVRVLSREGTRADHLAELGADVQVGDVRRAETLTPAMVGVDVVVSAVQGFAGPGGVSPASVDRDGNANLVDAAAAAGAGVVLVSIVGASADSPFELFRMKHAAEVHLAESGVPATVVRSTAFADLWIELLRQTAKRSGRPVVFGRGDNPINLIAVDDVAAVLDEVVEDPGARGSTIEVGGPADVSFNELAAAVQRADGRTSSPRHVPPVVLRAMAGSIGRLKPELGRQVRAALVMDRVDLTWRGTHAADTASTVGTTTVDELLGEARRSAR